MKNRLKKLRVFWQKHNWAILVACSIALIAVTLRPYFNTGYYGDDVIQNTLRIDLAAEGKTLTQSISNQISDWAATGRFFPASVTIGHLFWYYLFDDLTTYRVVHLLFLAVCFLLFARVITRFGGSRELALLACLLLTGLFQIRLHQHDPIASYGPLMQLLFIAGLSSVLTLDRYLLTRKPGWLVASVALYAFSLLYYELSLLFLPVISFQLLRNHQKTARRNPWPLAFYGTTTLIYFAIVGWLRFTQAVTYPGIKIQFSAKILRAFIYQFLAPLPLIHPVFGRSGFFPPEVLLKPPFLSLESLLIFSACLAVFAALFRGILSTHEPSRATGHKRISMLAFLGGVLMLFPPFIVSFSEKYQAELTRPGTCYLPVFFSYFGLAIFIGIFFERLLHRHTRTRRAKFMGVRFALCALLPSSVITLSHAANTLAVARINETLKLPRLVFEGAVNRGFFSELPEGAKIIHGLAGQRWMNSVFWKSKTGRATEFIPIDTIVKRDDCSRTSRTDSSGERICEIAIDPNSAQGPVYYYGFRRFESDTGVAFFTKIGAVKFNLTRDRLQSVIPAEDISVIVFSRDGYRRAGQITLSIAQAESDEVLQFRLSDFMNEQRSGTWFKLQPLPPDFNLLSIELSGDEASADFD